MMFIGHYTLNFLAIDFENYFLGKVSFNQMKAIKNFRQQDAIATKLFSTVGEWEVWN